MDKENKRPIVDGSLKLYGMINEFWILATNMYNADNINKIFMVVLSLIEINCDVTRIRISDLEAVYLALNVYVGFIFLLVEDDALCVSTTHHL